MKNVYVAIMAGGIGSRFWPESRVKKPKQFLDILNSGKTLIQSTFDRFLKIVAKDNIFIVTGEQYLEEIEKQLPGVRKDRILAEPMRRNTAPCIAYVSHKIASLDAHANIIIAPSDHLILNENKFFEVILKAISYTDMHNDLVTLGIKPTRPDTGYGYIQFNDTEVADGVYKVKTFTEKPDFELARTFMSSGEFLWNAGIFVWNTNAIIHAMDAYLQEMNQLFWEARKSFNSEKEKKAIEKVYSRCTNISIDYGVMEKAHNAYVIPSAFGWSDLGTWASLWTNYEKDYLGNAVKGKKVMIYDATNCMVMTPDEKLVVLEGLNDFIVVDTGDVLLICKKENEQQIKEITADMKMKGMDNYL